MPFLDNEIERYFNVPYSLIYWRFVEHLWSFPCWALNLPRPKSGAKMQIKEKQFNIRTSQSTPALHFLDKQYLLYFENTKQLLKWGIQEFLFFCYWTWPRKELQIHCYENLACPGAHRILWLSNEELKLGIRH